MKKRPYHLIAIMSLVFVLVGCASTGLKSNNPPPDLMTSCDALPAFNPNNSSNTADLIGYNISVMQAYGKCSLKLQNLQTWVKGNSTS